MQRRHQVIAVVMLATALAADRVATAAAPVLRPQIVQTARKISDRLTRSFREVVPAQRMTPARIVRVVTAAPDRIPSHQTRIHSSAGSVFRFRLPPPIA
jgi:plasmid stabilization system protein ParE